MEGKKPYMVFDPPQTLAVETGLKGIAFDFNLGIRVSLPEGNYRVRFIDRATHLTVYDAKASGVTATSTKRYFVDWRLEVWDGEDMVFSHAYLAKDKNVLMKFAGAALGGYAGMVPLCRGIPEKAWLQALRGNR